MSFTVQAVYTDMLDYFSGRSLPQASAFEWIRKTVLELTETYKFPDIQTTGPQVQLTQYFPGPYLYDTFFQPSEVGLGLDISCIDSWWVYYETPVDLASSNGENPGIQLKFRTIDVLEQNMNIIGLPTYWTRYNGALFVAFAPDQAYTTYVRYRKQQTFSTPVEGTDPILMPLSWQDVVGYAASERGARSLNLNQRANDFHNIVYGDPKFQLSGGKEGAPGLIFMHTSQEERDKTRAAISLRLRIPRASRRR